MIKFKSYRSENDKLMRITVQGHAGYGEEGTDIVCAAVSTAVWMAFRGIEEQNLAEVRTVEEEALIDCSVSEERSEAADAILNSLILTVYELAKQYPKNIFLLEA